MCEATDNANALDDRCREYVTNMYDYEKVKDKIVIKLLSLEKNAEYLKDKMYIKYLDFAMVFQLLITMPENRIMTSAMLSQVDKHWGVSDDELYAQALKNMQSLLPASLESLNSKILKMAEEKNVEFPEDIDISGGITPLYVLSNKYMTDGATAVLCKDVQKNFTKEQAADTLEYQQLSKHWTVLVFLNKKDSCWNIVKSKVIRYIKHIVMQELVVRILSIDQLCCNY